MNVSRIVLALLLIVGAGGALAGGTTAFFSDTETSTGNTFTAGAIDLMIDNDSYYNGNHCENAGTIEAPVWQWVGSAAYPVPGTTCTTSWLPSNLDGLLFFNFLDMKPDDEGEDTISIHVQNDAWACMDLTLTSNDDNSSTEPELGDSDVLDVPEDAWDGEMAQNLDFFWWADDGDNVYEQGEQPLTKNGEVQTLYDLATSTGSFSIVLADASGNAWGGSTPIPANETVYIAKAWCLGNMTLDDLTQDGSGVLRAPNDADGPGVICDGTALDNKTQTDSAQVSIVFRAEQARNNPNFRCNPPDQRTATLTVNKAIFASTQGIAVEDFVLHIVGPGGDQIVTDEVPVPGLPVGSYTVYEVVTGDVAGKDFITTFSGVCATAGDVMTSDSFQLNANDNVTCTIVNDEIGDFIPPTNN